MTDENSYFFAWTIDMAVAHRDMVRVLSKFDVEAAVEYIWRATYYA